MNLGNALLCPACSCLLVMAEEFRLHEELLKLQEDPKQFFIPNAITIEGANDKELERYLNGL